MTMTFTTSAGKPLTVENPNAEEGLEWIFDPAKEDGRKLGLSWETSGANAHNILEALELARGHNHIVQWTANFKEVAQKYLQTADPEDDYLTTRIKHLIELCSAGEARGAKFLILE